jgi:uncharacterized protein YdhG (YjbR/CyaY superfamily)
VAGKRPTTIAGYIAAAPAVAQPHLRQLHALLKDVAPDAQEAIKWGAPFFVEPRFLYSFAAFKTYCVFVPSAETLAAFEKELASYATTKNFLKLPYDKPLPEALLRRIAKYQLNRVRARKDDAFW